MMPLPTARLARVAGRASAATAVEPRPRDRHRAGAGFFFLVSAALAMGLAGCSSTPPSGSEPAVIPAAAETSTRSETVPEKAPRPIAAPAETPRDEPRAAAPPAAAKPAEPGTRPRDADRRTATVAPIAPPSIERREAPPLPRVARESVPQVRAGDDVVALAVEHGFDPVPVAVPDNTRFSRLRIGMTKQDAEALLGRPETSLHYANEGARIPFFASDDSSRWETFYRGQGRLMFSGAWLTGEVRLIRIEFDPDEDGQPDADHPQRNSRQTR